MKRNINPENTDKKTNAYHISYFPEKETACIYFYGCNFRCLGCIRHENIFDIHLPEIVLKKIKHKQIKLLTLRQIIEMLSRRPIEKIIFMGGEPTADRYLNIVAKALKEKFGSFNALITNGYELPDIAFFDEVCVGLKARTERIHKKYTGRDAERVFENLKILNKSDILLRTESVFIPGFIDFRETECIVKAVAAINPLIPHRIDAYIPVPGMKWRRPGIKELKEVVRNSKKYLNRVESMSRKAGNRSVVEVLA